MLVEADVTLGLLVEELKKQGELENTLILFTSDNGGLARLDRRQATWNHNSNAGLRGSKAQIYEGGHPGSFHRLLEMEPEFPDPARFQKQSIDRIAGFVRHLC